MMINEQVNKNINTGLRMNSVRARPHTLHKFEYFTYGVRRAHTLNTNQRHK